jgi:cytochrome c biogenesis protein CcmG, thiol:disulfide interchange protein DsbE
VRRTLVLLLAVAVGGCEAAARGGPPQVGQPAPNFTATSLDRGAPVSLQGLRGKPVLLNVWATWCHPCRKEMPDLERLHRERGPTGLQVIGVSIDERGQDQAIREFLREFGVSYPVWLDPEDRVSPTFALIGVPGTFLIDGQGTLRWSRMGPIAADDPGLSRALDEVLRAAVPEPSTEAR